MSFSLRSPACKAQPTGALQLVPGCACQSGKQLQIGTDGGGALPAQQREQTLPLRGEGNRAWFHGGTLAASQVRFEKEPGPRSIFFFASDRQRNSKDTTVLSRTTLRLRNKAAALEIRMES